MCALSKTPMPQTHRETWERRENVPYPKPNSGAVRIDTCYEKTCKRPAVNSTRSDSPDKYVAKRDKYGAHTRVTKIRSNASCHSERFLSLSVRSRRADQKTDAGCNNPPRDPLSKGGENHER